MQRILVHGRSRSGTTITQQILNSHPKIQLVNEKHIYTRSSDVDELLKKEKKLYDGKSLFFGDKHGTPPLEQFKIQIPLNIKYIFIYRDGRDSVSSGIRRKRGDGKIGWRSQNLKVNSKDWADYYYRWQEAKSDIIPPDSWCEIKFEDYVDRPGKNSTIIADFLDMDGKKLIKCEKNFIKEGRAHKGYYTEWVPNWEKEFHPDAIKVLRLLGYID